MKNQMKILTADGSMLVELEKKGAEYYLKYISDIRLRCNPRLEKA